MKKLVSAFKEIPSVVKVLLFFALALRIYLMNFPGFRIDINTWQGWAGRLLEVGPFSFYSPNLFADYFPFFYIFLWIISEFFSFFFGTSSIYSGGFELYFKFINNLFDLGTAFIIFLIVRKYNKKISFFAPIFYLLNPGTLFNVSVWGQTDSIPTFLLLCAIYFLNEKKPFQSGILSVLAFLVKPLNIPAIPIMFAKMISTIPLRRILATAVFSFLFGFLIILPFFPDNPILGMINKITDSQDTYPFTSLNAFNFWGIIGFWKPDSILFFGISYKTLGLIIFGIMLSIITFIFLKLRKKDINIDYLSYTLASFAFFMFLTRIHERHIFPVFALLLISAFIYKSRFLIISYISLSFIFFLNLFYSYYYYNFLYYNAHSRLDFLYFFVSDFNVLFSFLNSTLFVLILGYYLRLAINSEK